jgi:pimeloyl-ACP methyl ester carboxylesterase
MMTDPSYPRALKMLLIDVDGIKLNYQEKGNGPIVIMVHGIPTDYRVWGEQVEALSPSFRTVSYSRRCAFPNRNKDCANSTVENNAKDLQGLIDSLGGGPVHLIGHSYGAAAAAYCALKNPSLVRSMVLIEPYLPTMVLKDPDSSIQGFSLLLRKPSVALSARKATKNNRAMFKELDRKNYDRVLQMFLDGLQDRPDMIKQYSAGNIEMMRANVTTVGELRTGYAQFTKEDAIRVTHPTLLLTGERSIKALQAIVEALHDSMPNNLMIKVKDAGHLPHIENPEECNKLILKFLTEHND